MTALPHPMLPPAPTGQPDSGGHYRTAGQPDSGPRAGVGHTAAGTPVFVFNPEPWASLYLVSVTHDRERRHSWVLGSPERLIELAQRIGVAVEVKRWWEALDETLPPVEFLS